MAVKIPETGDVSKSAKFFDTLVDSIEYADNSPYPDMAVAIVLQNDNWLDRLMVRLARRAIKVRALGNKVPAVS